MPVSFLRWLTTEKATVAGVRAVPNQVVRNVVVPNEVVRNVVVRNVVVRSGAALMPRRV
jgi:hypothetical protein